MSYAEISYRMLKKFSNKYAYLIEDLKNDLKQADLNYTIEEYFSMLVLTTIILSISVFCIGGFIFFFVIRSIGIAIIGGFILSLFISLITIIVFIIYPSQLKDTRKKKIENNLYFAANYMSTISSSGLPPQKIFAVIGNFSEFGEIAKISKRITRDIEIFGMNVNEAIEKVVQTSPSKKLNELLWGMRGIIVSGGDLTVYLKEKSKSLLNDYRRILEEFTRSISLYLEIYITLIMVGTVFTLVLTTIMSLLGGYIKQLQLVQMIIVTIGLPFISGVFVLLLKTISPTET